MAKDMLLKLAVKGMVAAEKVAQKVSESRVARFFRWAEEEVRKGPDENATGWEGFKRGFLAYSGLTLKAGLVVLPFAVLMDALAVETEPQQPKQNKSGLNNEIEDTISTITNPFKTAMCEIRNVVVPGMFVAGVIGIAIGGILKAFQVRSAGAWLIGGVFGVVAATFMLVIVNFFGGQAMNQADAGTDWKELCSKKSK